MRRPSSSRREVRERHFETRSRTHRPRTSPTRARRGDGPQGGCGPSDSGFEVLEHGLGPTMCRLNFSSDSLIPAATPTSCERWRIGSLKSRPVVGSSFDCHASSDRWHSGHGVTIASAPASSACSIGWISSPSAVSSRAWMIGNPQHLIFADSRSPPATRLDDPLERPRAIGILEAHDLRRAQDLAAVERRDLQALEATVRGRLQQLVALALGDLPQQVADVDILLYARNADGDEILVHARAELVVAVEHEVRLAQVERADVADREQRVATSRPRTRGCARSGGGSSRAPPPGCRRRRST